MPTTLSAYALERIETLALDVVADGDRVTVVGHDTVRCLLPVKRPGPGVAGSGRCPLRNLAPADLKKDANGFDLSIALGLLLASGQVAFDRPGNFAIAGELALTGETRPIKGILSMAIQAVAEGRDGLLVPRANASLRPPSSKDSMFIRSPAWPRRLASSPGRSRWTLNRSTSRNFSRGIPTWTRISSTRYVMVSGRTRGETELPVGFVCITSSKEKTRRFAVPLLIWLIG